MNTAKPLCGGNYISSFADKFKLSKTFDVANSHEWTLFLHNSEEPYVIQSIPRDKSTGEIRFWRKGNRSKGSGYIQLPVIYLSLKRLFPIGEDDKIHQSTNVELTADEIKLYQELHNEVLISLDSIVQADYLESPNKNTLGVNTDYYDWSQNSAGQDNIGKIILALLSFRRLKKDFPDDYKGGLLVIDEIDATMYPASQNKLIEILRKYASKLSLQIIFTTHSLSLLEKVCKLQKDLSLKEVTKNQVKVIFLEKCTPFIIQKITICLKSILHLDVIAVILFFIGNRLLEKIESPKGRFATLKSIGNNAFRPQDGLSYYIFECLIRHEPIGLLQTFLGLITIKAIVAVHVAHAG